MPLTKVSGISLGVQRCLCEGESVRKNDDSRSAAI